LVPGTLYAAVYSTNGAAQVLVASNANTVGSYQLLSFTYDQQSGAAAFYRNASKVAEANFGNFAVRTGDPLWLGRRPTTGSNYLFKGSMDEVLLFNRALSSSEIASIYAAGSSGLCFTNDPAPVFAVQPASQTGYLFQSATFTGLAMGVPRPDYQWLSNGIPIPGATKSLSPK
jgi:hypothetical protein